VFAITFIFAIIIASVGLGLLPSLGVARTSQGTSATTSGSGGSLTLCPGLTPAQVILNAKAAGAAEEQPPNYDEQLLLGFEQNFTSSISYNVTLRAQNDSFGYGPVYLLNGLTDPGFWYQVGIAWNLAEASGAFYAQGFRFVYEVWNTNTGLSIFPQAGGTLPSRFLASDGDIVQLSLDITRAGQISMSAFDWNTSAKATASYDGFGATEFLANKDRVTGFPTSLLTEWYHVVPYFCSEKAVVYSSSIGLKTAWMRIDEWNLTSVPASQRFNSTLNGQCCVFATAYQGVNFQQPTAFRSLMTNGTAIYANANEFVTP
jgi:hypothetical protein